MRRWMLEQAQDAAHRRANGDSPPQSVIDMAHADAILEDQRRSEAREASTQGHAAVIQ